MACLALFFEMNTIKTNTASKFQQPCIRGHSRSCSLNWNEPGNMIEITRQFLWQWEFWTWACDQLTTNNWSADNFKRVSPQWVLYLSPQYSRVTADSVFWQSLSIDHNMDVHYQVLCLKTQIVYMPWTPSNMQ